MRPRAAPACAETSEGCFTLGLPPEDTGASLRAAGVAIHTVYQYFQRISRASYGSSRRPKGLLMMTIAECSFP